MSMCLPLCWGLLLSLFFAVNGYARQGHQDVIRVAVINGMIHSQLWPEITHRFEKRYPHYRLELVASAGRPQLKVLMEQGKLDLLTMHSGDITTDLVATGHAINMRPWARNALVIWGPTSDPAGIRGMRDGAQALARIAATKSNWIDFQGIGPREMAHNLWARAGIRPLGGWVIKNDLPGGRALLKEVEKRHAYIITGRMPALVGQMIPPPGLEMLVDSDPTMRRSYIILEANPARHPEANHTGARLLSDFLVSKETQLFLRSYNNGRNDGRPLFYPVWPWCQEISISACD